MGEPVLGDFFMKAKILHPGIRSAPLQNAPPLFEKLQAKFEKSEIFVRIWKIRGSQVGGAGPPSTFHSFVRTIPNIIEKYAIT